MSCYVMSSLLHTQVADCNDTSVGINCHISKSSMSGHQLCVFCIALYISLGHSFSASLGFNRYNTRRISTTTISMKAIEVAMPALSSTMKEGKIVAWSKNVGDKVEVGDVLMVVESDKADMDVEAFEEGL